MKNIGKKIKEIRMIKGISQEQLAELSKTNIRTIQRIENNETEPRATTLQLICQAMNVSVENITEYVQIKDNQYIMRFYLSVFSNLIIPFGNVIFPYIFWSAKRDKVIGLELQGKRLLNFQLIVSILTNGFFITFVLLKIMQAQNYMIIFWIFIAINILNYLFTMYCVAQNKNGNQAMFPKTIHIF